MNMRLNQRISRMLILCAFVALTLQSLTAYTVSTVTVLNNTKRTYEVANDGVLQFVAPGDLVSLKNSDGTHRPFRYKLIFSTSYEEGTYSDDSTSTKEFGCDGSPTRSNDSSFLEDVPDDTSFSLLLGQESTQSSAPKFHTFEVVHGSGGLKLYRICGDMIGGRDHVGTLSFEEMPKNADLRIVLVLSDEWITARLDETTVDPSDVEVGVDG